MSPEPRIAEWHPRRVIVSPYAVVDYLWRRAGWGHRILAVVLPCFIFLDGASGSSEWLFGVRIAEAVGRIPLVFAFSGMFLNFSGTANEWTVGAVRLWRRSWHKRRVVITLWQDGNRYAEDRGIAWVDGGLLHVEGLRFASAFTSRSAKAAHLSIEFGDDSSVGGRGWVMCLNPVGGDLSLAEELGAWRTQAVEGFSVLPPADAAPQESLFLRFGHIGPEIALLAVWWAIPNSRWMPEPYRSFSDFFFLAILACGLAARVYACMRVREAERAMAGSIATLSVEVGRPTRDVGAPATIALRNR